MGQGLQRNQVQVPPAKPRPTQEQMTADLLASGQPIQPVQPAQPGPVDNLLQGLGGGAKAVLEGFGDFVNKQKETPEGRLLLTNLLAGVTVGLGADPAIGANIVQQGQKQFELGVAREEKQADRQFKLDVLGAKQKTEARTQENKLRKEFIPFKDQFQEAQTAQDKVVKSLARETAAGDVSAVFAYMKVLDPRSVVREGEQATARNAAGIPERIRNAYNRTLTGESLTPEQRQDFLETSQSLFQSEQDKYIANKKVYEDIATRQGLNVLNVVGEDRGVVIPKGITTIKDSKSTTPKVYDPQTEEFK
tara:strand:+ start:18291 stop:19208 length:918 start_codon:yes stop_codon:yes gene_type:complete